MRISDQQIINLTQYDVNADYEQLARAQTVLSTGRQITTPADNPIGTAVALELQGSLAETNQFAATAGDTQSWLQTTDASLGTVGDALLQARTLAVQGSNGMLTLQEQQALAANVAQLVQQAIQAANGQDGGRYVLAGNQTSTAPFVLTTAGGSPVVQYKGDNGVMQREISPGQMMPLNMPGSTALPAVFKALLQLQNDLQAGNSAAIGGSDLQALDQAHDGLLLAQTMVGASLSRIQAVQQTLQTTQTTLTQRISTIVDADMAQAAVTFSTRQATYQAALSAAAKVVQPTLLDFLR